MITASFLFLLILSDKIFHIDLTDNAYSTFIII